MKPKMHAVPPIFSCGGALKSRCSGAASSSGRRTITVTPGKGTGQSVALRLGTRALAGVSAMASRGRRPREASQSPGAAFKFGAEFFCARRLSSGRRGGAVASADSDAESAAEVRPPSTSDEIVSLRKGGGGGAGTKRNCGRGEERRSGTAKSPARDMVRAIQETAVSQNIPLCLCDLI